MKKFGVILLLFAVTGCDASIDYQPKLKSPPKDAAKYDTDRKYCIKFANEYKESGRQNHVSSGRTILPFLGGAVGAAVDGATHADQENDWALPATTLTDQCLIKKGYKVIAQ